MEYTVYGFNEQSLLVIMSNPLIHSKAERQSVQVMSLSGHRVSNTISISIEFYLTLIP